MMLQKLTIQNYAIIDQLEIRFSPHLNIITGETGAGKSILLGAMQLILGERAAQETLYDKASKCVIEGAFETKDTRVFRFLEKQGLDSDNLTVVRREISGNGKSRAFVNDTPVNLDQLGELASLLVDLHQQFDTRKLGSRDFQMDVLDALCQHEELLRQYRDIFQSYRSTEKELEQLKEQQAAASRELDYHNFLLKELDELGFADQEIEDLEAELKQLTHAEDIKTAMEGAYDRLSEGEAPLIGQLKQIQSSIQSVADFHPDLPQLSQRLAAAGLELQDMAGDIARINDRLGYDGERIVWINDRLAAGYRLLKKHHLRSTAELLLLQHSLRDKLVALTGLEDRIGQMDTRLLQLQDKLDSMAAELSAERKKQALPLTERVNELLKQVGMPNARLKVEIHQSQAGYDGKDELDFLFDANAAGHYQLLGKVASGGELSRLMLCIKSLVARTADLPTMIFDEIDTGISGEAGRQAALILKSLASDHQVICITHQPQIAGKADAHYYVYKEVTKDRIVTRIKLLSLEERIMAIARMLGGETPTAAALENAREMVNP